MRRIKGRISWIAGACFLPLFLLLCSPALSQQADSLIPNRPYLYPNWMLFVPGATHFHDHHIMDGLVFASLETGGIVMGIAFDKDLRANSTSPYYNFPLLAGLQAYNIDKCDFMENRLDYFKAVHPDFRYDPMRFNQLLVAPFKPRNIFTPITGGFVLAALIELYFDSRNADHSFRDVKDMYFIHHYIDRNPAMGIFGPASLAASYGAGVAEEYWFRNGLMTLWDYRYGQKKGLLYSSLFFGSMHLTNLFFSSEPNLKDALLQVAEATIAGYFLGRSVQKRNYSIGPAVAAHTWYDFTLMLGSFIADPEENVFGVRVRFAIQ